MEPQFHDFHEVFLLLRGAVIFRLYRNPGTTDAEAEEHRLHTGDYLIVPAGTGHIIHDARGSTLVLVACTDDAVRSVPGRREVWGDLISASLECGAIRSAPLHLRDTSWRELIALSPHVGSPDVARPPGQESRKEGAPSRMGTSDPYNPASTTRRLELENAFSRFLLELSRLSRRPRLPDARERVQALAATLHEFAHEQWTLDRAAGAVYLSRRRFSDLWRSVTGETFITTLQRLRVSTAQRLMTDDRLSIAGAAFAAGFDDVTHFYRVFHKYVGMPPGTWSSMRT